MGDILSLARKFERAMRNGTGFQITSDEVIAAVEDDVLDAIHAAKLKRLKQQCLAKPAPMSSENTGSINGGTALPRRSGKSPPIGQEAAKSYIAAHGFGT